MQELISAIIKNDYIKVKKSLKNIDDINTPLELDECENIFFFAVKKKANTEILKLLIESGLELSYQDKNGVGIFDEAMNYNDLEFIKYLVEKKGFNPLVTNRKSGFTPLMQAVSYGYLEIVKYLISLGADINQKDNFGFNAKDYARKLGQIRVYNYLKTL